MNMMIRRMPIFETVRAILGRGFTQSEVDRIDAAIDQALGIRPEPQLAPRPPIDSVQGRIGRLSEKYESGGRGPGTVSGGKDDPGGVSYGTYQLASRTGTVARFVETEGAAWADELSDTPGTATFSAAWRRIAEAEPDAFDDAQRAFIRRTHYEPVVKAVSAATGVNLDIFPDAVRDVAWSVAIQHGGAAKILIAAIGKTGAGDPARLIEAIYAERTAYVLKVAGRYRGRQRALLENITRSRYPAELADALAMLRKELARG